MILHTSLISQTSRCLKYKKIVDVIQYQVLNFSDLQIKTEIFHSFQ